MNIHLITSLESGGAQKILHDYLFHLTTDERANSFVISLRGQDFYTNKIKRLGVQVLNIFTLAGFFFCVKIFFINNKSITCWMYHTFLVSIPYKIFNNRSKVYWYIHHGFLDKTDSLSTRFFARISALFSKYIPDRILYVSDCCRRHHEMYGFDPKNSEVIFNNVKFPLDERLLRKKLEKKSDTISITFIGRDHPNKNLDLFIESAFSLLEKNIKFRFYIVGKGVRNRLILDKFSKYIYLYDELECLDDIYQKTDIFISTSRVESFGLTIIEAISYGCKVLVPSLDIFKEVTFGMAHYYEMNDSALDNLVNAVMDLTISDFNINFYNRAKTEYSSSNTIFKLKKVIG